MSLANRVMKEEFDEECEEESIIIRLDDHFRSSALTNFYRNIPKYDSKLIDRHQFLQLFQGKELKTFKTPQLLYRASRDGFSSESFHKCCDDQFKVVIIVKSKDGDLFGGYTTKNLRPDGSTVHVRDDQLFTFRFENEKLYTFRLQTSLLDYVLHRYDTAHLFAFGYCFWVCENANINSNSGSHQAENYILPECKLPSGSTYFFSQSNLVEDLEVHKIMD